MRSEDDSTPTETPFEALATALAGTDVDAVRCPECGVHYLSERWPGVWCCQRCGRVENPRSDSDATCPYCGRRGLALYWEEAMVECDSCGVVDKGDLRAIVTRRGR